MWDLSQITVLPRFKLQHCCLRYLVTSNTVFNISNILLQARVYGTAYGAIGTSLPANPGADNYVGRTEGTGGTIVS